MEGLADYTSVREGRSFRRGPVTVSVVIPCYYSQNTIQKVVSLTREQLVGAGYDYEFVLVNDGSTDETFERIQQLCAEDTRIVGVDCAKNKGQHNALMAGLKLTRGDYILLMDDDMQTHPSQALKLLRCLEESGKDVVFAEWPEHKEAAWRQLGSRFQAWTVCALTGRPKGIYSSNYLVMRRHVREAVVCYKGPFVYIQGLIFQATNSYCNVEVEHFEREEGTSGYTLKSLVRLWANILGFSLSPLRAAMWLGFALALVGVIEAVVLLVAQAVAGPVEGLSFVVALMLFLSGLILFFVGLSGEYVGRTLMTVSNAPQFVPRAVIDSRPQGRGDDAA